MKAGPAQHDCSTRLAPANIHEITALTRITEGNALVIDLTGYKLTFDDEFNARSISQNAKVTTWADVRSDWRYDVNSDIGFGHSSFVDPASGYDPFKLQDGALSITAVPDRTPYGYPGSWESGLITTQGHFSQTYGYFEIRSDFADAKGGWDAFWLLPDKPAANPNNLPGWQELDVVEHYGDNNKGVYSTIHTTDQTPNIPWQQNRQVYSETAQADGYHTYGMDWQKDKISFYVDGQFVGAQATPSDMNGPMYLLANLATQDGANPSGGPITMKIDYIRAYSNNPNAVAVAQGAVSAPDGHDPGLYGATAAGSPPSSPAATPTPTPTPTPTTAKVGSGPDALVLRISEDAYKGDAQYTVSVDGKQVGGTLTAHASHAAGQSDTVTVNGDWAAGDHTVGVTFLNDAYDGTPTTDRNLYLDSATYNGAAVSGGHLTLLSAGTQNFTAHEAGQTAPPAATPTPTPTPTTAKVGSGPDALVLRISEDAYKGDAQYTVSVDGKQVGGTLTAHASHAAGQSDTVTVNGDWAAGDHTIGVTFLNDVYDGTPTTDRNLYLDSATYNGAAVSGGHFTLLSAGTQSFTAHEAGQTAPPAATPTPTPTPTTAKVGSGPDALVLRISEDAYKGDAQYTVSVDGKQVGGTLTAHASHAVGQSDTVTVNGDWAAGDHTVGVTFLNDAYDGTPTTDRNLYLDSATYNGAAVSGAHFTLLSAGTQNFTAHEAGLIHAADWLLPM